MISFNEVIETPEIWFQQAWEMFEASSVTYDSFLSCKSQKTDSDRQRKLGLMKGVMLFLGLAVENALKGAVVYKAKPDLRNGKLSPKHFHEYAHDLKDVAGKLDVDLSDIPNDYLDRLSMFVQWASKYKAPLRLRDYDDSQGNIKMQVPTDFDSAKVLINRLQVYSGYSEENGWPHQS